MYVTLNCKRIPRIEVAYTSCLASSLNIFTGKTLVSRDSHILTSLRVLTFLTRAYVRPETPTHVPLQPLFIPIPNLFYFCIQISSQLLPHLVHCIPAYAHFHNI